jgi:hypothetical protein
VFGLRGWAAALQERTNESTTKKFRSHTQHHIRWVPKNKKIYPFSTNNRKSKILKADISTTEIYPFSRNIPILKNKPRKIFKILPQ